MDNVKWTPSLNIQDKYIVSASTGLESDLVAIIHADEPSEAKRRAALCAGSKNMYSALRAIKARLEGDYDNPHLVAMGPLSDYEQNDIMRFVEQALKEVRDNI